MAEEEAAPEVDPTEDEASGSARRALVVGAPILALALGAAGWLLLRGDTKQDESSALAAHEEVPAPEGEAQRSPLRESGIDYEAELGVFLPAAVASSEGGEASGNGRVIGQIVPLESFVVNISDRERDRYLKLKAELELSAPEVSDELDQRMPQVRDLIISLLGSKSFEDVRTIEGKNFLREEILLRINALLVSGAVKRVFFTEFVVQ